jgi:hypothetical protein
MQFNVSTLWGSPLAPVQLIALLGLLVLLRGAPLSLYRQELAPAKTAFRALFGHRLAAHRDRHRDRRLIRTYGPGPGSGSGLCRHDFRFVISYSRRESETASIH